MDTQNGQQNSDTPEEKLQDMTVNNSGEMQAVDDAPKNDITPPISVMDVTPPPEDPVVKATPNVSNVQPQPTEPHSEEVPVESKVVLPTGADPDVPKPEKHAKGSGKGLAVAIIVVLAIIFAAIAVLVFMKTNSNTKSASKSSGKTSETADAQSTPAVTSNDVDTAVKEVDDTLNTLNDSQDFSADGLSDKTLGLQ